MDIKKNLEDIRKEVVKRFGGLVSVDYSNLDDKEELVVQSFVEDEEGVMNEVHYGRFNSIKEANDYYFKQAVKESHIPTKYNGGDFRIELDSDGVYYLNGYESAPVEPKELNDDCKIKTMSILGYKPDVDFTNDNGKVLVKAEVWIPMEIKPSEDHKNINTNVTKELEFIFPETLSSIINVIKPNLFSINSEFFSKANTKYDIFELFYGKNKINRL